MADLKVSGHKMGLVIQNITFLSGSNFLKIYLFILLMYMCV